MLSPSAYVRHTMQRLPEPMRELGAMRLAAWTRRTGVRPYLGRMRRCLRKLGNPRHRCGTRCYPYAWLDALDHSEWWVAPHGGYVITAHPYGIGGRGRRQLLELAEREGVRLTIDADWSWYAPGQTTLVVLWGRPGATTA